ncbi:ubiquitin-protein transferase [Aureococcus anophagefferens]|nr:ubiquitin-protein transferase [Aureococcus anophagefferens]
MAVSRTCSSPGSGGRGQRTRRPTTRGTGGRLIRLGRRPRDVLVARSRPAAAPSTRRPTSASGGQPRTRPGPTGPRSAFPRGAAVAAAGPAAGVRERYDAAYAHVLPPRNPGDYLPESALTYDALLALDRPAAPSKAAVATKKQLISKALTTSVYRKPAEPTGEEDNECCICLDEFEDEERIKKLRCGPLFHLNCIKKWLLADMRCPTCRQPVADAAPG